jgi:hypothetical protein
MRVGGGSTNSGSGVARTVGFWLGLVLFVGLLLVPPPVSMHDAGTCECFAGKLRAHVAVILSEWERPQARCLYPTTGRAGRTRSLIAPLLPAETLPAIPDQVQPVHAVLKLLAQPA